ncbi:fibroblast growth factor receptor 3-like [Uloborus diversus]|uniref:fibroblast growth factor receptor 3-like n=1 Tax=Uloborus diversus TaxID=327109 RepID=UPI002408FE31|nr:fibroblast growth factor receptor 3-like [Uloborus diversus]
MKDKVIVPSGIDVTLSCLAGGYPPPSIAWFKNFTAIHDGNLGSNDAWEMEIHNVSTNDAGLYSCIASNSEGKVQFNFSLSILKETNNVDKSDQIPPSTDTHKPPYFMKPDNMIELVAKPAGSTVALKCQADGNPTPTITWKKNGLLLQKSGHIRFQKWALKIDQVTIQDQGVYTCLVSNILGTIQYNFTLEVIERLPHRPIMQENFPSNQTVYLGESAVFECKFISDLHASAKWVKHIEVNGSAYDEYGMPYLKYIESKYPDEPNLLTLENVTFEDAGKYACIATNTFGSSKQSAWLTVLNVPEPEGTSEIYIILTGILMGLILCLLLVFLIHRKHQQKRRQLSNKAIPFFVKKKIVLVPQTSGSSENLAAPLVKIQSYNLNYEASNGALSEYELPYDPAWEFPRDQLVFGKPLGHGAFGQVFQAEAVGLSPERKSTTVAVKMLKDGHCDQDVIDLISEVEVMKAIGTHPNIINLLGCCTQNGPLHVIVEYAAHGNLRDYLRAHRPVTGYEISIADRKIVTEKNLTSFAFQVAKGMKYLASKKVHR